MGEWWFWLLLIIGVPYVGGPALIRFSQKMAAKPRFYPLQAGDLPEEAAAYLYGTTNALLNVGFIPAAYLSMPDQVPNVRTYLVMLVNRAEGDKAMVTQMYATTTGAARLATSYLEFSTRFENGQSIETLNSDTLNSFKAGADEVKTQAPAVKDPQELYRLHQYMMEKRARGGAKVVYDEGQEIPYLCRVIVESYEQQVRFGWLSLSRSEEVYRPTWKGAFLMTWGLLWPVNALRKSLMRRNEQKALNAFRADLAAGRWSPARPGSGGAPARG
jgi:hypothetical protein